MTTMGGPSVVVVGASLGGLAAAVRLAKLGHQVTVVDAQSEPAPHVPDLIELPAAWRDLFRKSGRILDAALAEAGLDLVGAPGLPLSDGTVLPTDRGEQFATLSAAYGLRTAETWRDLLDGLDDTWQVVRRLGLEAELDPQDSLAAGLLADQRTVSELAHPLPDPLADHVLRVALDRGIDPDAAPAWWATQLCVRRTFGLWRLMDSSGTAVPGRRLTDLLLARAERRCVTRQVDRVAAIAPDGQGLALELVDGARMLTETVVSAVDLWQHRRLLGVLAPSVRRRLGPLPWGTARLATTPTGRPAWTDRDTWQALEPVTTSTPGLFYAGSGTVAGDLPWARLLVGALATYGVHEALTGQDVRPSNRAGHRPRAARIPGSA